jgi:hypothetical protein
LISQNPAAAFVVVLVVAVDAAEFVRQLPKTSSIQYRSSIADKNGPGGS